MMTECEELKVQRILAMIEHLVPSFGTPMFVLVFLDSVLLRYIVSSGNIVFDDDLKRSTNPIAVLVKSMLCKRLMV